jgi:Uma2 family endonuclease
MAAGDTTPRVAEQRRPPAGKLSYEEFLDWCDEDALAEWVRGEVRVTSPASLRHQDLMRFLLIVLHFWVRSRDLGVVIAPPRSDKYGA